MITNVVKKESGYGWQVNVDAIGKNLMELVSFPSVQTKFEKETLFVGGGYSTHITQVALFSKGFNFNVFILIY